MKPVLEAFALSVFIVTAFLMLGTCIRDSFVGIQLRVGTASASDDEERLMVDVFRGYNSLIQPVKHLNDTPIVVKIALQLILLINVDEKDQVNATISCSALLTLN